MSCPVYYSVSEASETSLVMLIDADNFMLTGGGSRRRLNEERISECAQAAGAEQVIAYAGYFYPKERKRLIKYGIKPKLTGRNADKWIINRASRLFARGFDAIIASGDGEMGQAITEAARHHGRLVDFYALSRSASRSLPISRFCEDWIIGPKPRNPFWRLK